VREPLGAGAHRRDGLLDHAHHRDLGRYVEVERECSLERGQRQLVRAQRALERMPSQLLDEVGPTGDDPRLRAAEQLVAGEADEIGSGRERVPRGRLVRERDQCSRSEVVDEGDPVACRDVGKLGRRRLLGEADDAEVRLVDAQEEGGLGPDRVLVVVHAGAVRRPDLDQPGAGPGEDVRDPEAVADLDQLATRDQHLASVRECGEREQDGGRVVVDHERRLGAGQPAQDRGDVVLPRAPCALGEVVLEVRVAAGDLAQPVERLLRQRCAAEVGVDDHAGCVQDAPETRPTDLLELGPQAGGEVARLDARADLLSSLVEHAAGRVDGERIVGRAGKLVHGREVSKLHVS
jgi:hypothetical protein